MTREDLVPIHQQIEAITVNYPQSMVSWAVSKTLNKHCAQLIWLENGSATLFFRRESMILSPPRLLWIPAGMLKRLEISSGSNAIVVNVCEDLLLQTVNRLSHSDIPYRILLDSLHNYQLNPVQIDDCMSCIQVIQQELLRNQAGMRAVIGSQLVTLLTHIYRHQDCKTLVDDSQWMGSTISQRFLQLVELHFHEHWRISDYAQQLGVTERRLELTLQRDFNQAPSALVHRKLINEAIQKLEYSSLSISEIAYGLGYRDPSYFNRFFKRLTNYAPGAWRRLARQNEVKLDTSYAAWP